MAYANTLKASFHLDDWPSIVENRYVHLKELSLSNLMAAAAKGPNSNRPVANLSFALNYYFGGLNAIGYHLVNQLIHTLTGIILYFLLVTTLDLGPLRGKYEKREWLALTVALLWAVHPVQTQSVTYIVQRMNGMAGMFFLLSLYLYVRGRRGGTTRVKVWFYSGSGAAGLLALGSKEIAAVLPLMLALYEFYFFQGLDLREVRRRWFWVVGIMGMLLIIVLVFLGPNFIRGVLAGYQDWDFTLGERLLTQLRVVMYYLSLLLFPLPSRLNVDYDFAISHSFFNPVSTLFSFLGILGLVGLGVYLARRRPLASFGIFWFLGNLVVESSVIPLDMAFEHRLYLPLLGFLLFLVGIGGVRRKALIYGAFPVILIFSIWTIQRNIVWKDELTLWSDCLNKSPNKARPHRNLGFAYLNEGMFDEAIKKFRQALQIRPDHAKTHKNLGIAYFNKGMDDEAIREYRQALRINPNFADTYRDLGDIYLNKGMFAEAIREYRQALWIDPDYTEVHNNLGLAFYNKGMFAEAIREFQQATRLSPDLAEAFYNLGNAYAKKGMYDEAIREYQQALRLRPDLAAAHMNLGIAYAKKGMDDEAIREYQQATWLGPDFAEAFYNLGNAYAKKGMYDEAIREYQQALRLKPDLTKARYQLGIVQSLRDYGEGEGTNR